MTDRHASIPTILRRGLRRRCPRCGVGRLFRGFYDLTPVCPHCDLEYEPRGGDSWAFMYLSTAGMTGIILICMFLLRPNDLLLGRAIVGAGAVGLIVATLPIRKGFSLALVYLMGRGADNATDGRE